ncbi:acyl-CoA synthetase [Sphingomonas sp. Leaf412]|uniref:acyl-CoA synthetase n=1 Tax=Sphingomonas sp. Leaf412 TaxID=1736370 RepID=UPI000701B05A|nr:acyl-CoA synthetase [Sphingomonas sp. Leaf412]KQT33040.1 acyl-CoA synthetase [Sphingomonas sp. Leaf412]
MHPYKHAATSPDKAAYIMAATGETVTYAQLERRANQGAHLLRSLGLKRGDAIAVMMDNSPRYFEIMWATERAGVYVTCISSKLSVDEADYIIRDGECRALIMSKGTAGCAEALLPRVQDLTRYMVDGTVAGYESWEAARDAQPDTPIADPSPGQIMLYSSGTTGKPKGVRFPLPETPYGENVSPLVMLGQALYGFTPDMVYLSPAPLYHAAPLRWTMAVQQLGGTVVVMDRFDPEEALRLIEAYRVTHAQWVPTHFVRMLKLPAEARARHDMSSLKAVWHAAAPCPVPVKQAMIDWWGPIVGEYYAGTEGNGFHAISAAEWLTHLGSVGRNLTTITHIVGEDGNEVPARTEGTVYFEPKPDPAGAAAGPGFSYHNDPDKTREATDSHGWTTLGDVGFVDEEGYLYLTDRKSFMIISGGVNIYPAEIENLLVTHPKVADVAVIGAPHEEMGEQVVAVVQPRDMGEAGEALAAELTAFAREHLSHVKTPRRIDFRAELPRHDTGKLYKRVLRDEYWGKKTLVDGAAVGVAS